MSGNSVFLHLLGDFTLPDNRQIRNLKKIYPSAIALGEIFVIQNLSLAKKFLSGSFPKSKRVPKSNVVLHVVI